MATAAPASAAGRAFTGVSVTADGKGYALISSAGEVYAFGDVKYWDNPKDFSGSIVGISVTADGKGYAAISSAGQVYAYGSVQYRDNPKGFSGGIIGVAVTADGQGYVAASGIGQVYAYGSVLYRGNGDPGSGNGSAAAVASDILKKGSITLATVHSSGQVDNATARLNVEDTAAGREAHRSKYGTAPGGTVNLRVTMLKALLDLGGRWQISVSEIAGGSHNNSESYHYKGLAFDINRINGSRVNGSNSGPLVQRCKDLGARYAAYENGNHVHCDWSTGAP